MRGDWHVHTRFSLDSDAPVREMLDRAVALKMTDICFTDHYDMFFLDEGFTFDVDEYFRVMREYREEYRDRIRVHIGVELGLDTEHTAEIGEFAKSWPFEYIIGSVHKLFEKDPYERADYDCTDEEFYRAYFLRCAECIRANDCFDVFGHLDYVVRYGYSKAEHYSYAAYKREIDEILKALIEKNIPLEVNTAGLAKGVGFAHPHPDVLKRYIELGGRQYNMGSDAHDAAHLGWGFEETEKALNKLVFLQSIR